MTKKEARRRIIKEMRSVRWNEEKIKIILLQLENSTESIDISSKDIMFYSARACKTSIKSLRSRSRVRCNVVARNIIIKYLRDMGYSLESIGYLFNRDHSSILHSLKAFANDVKYDEFTRESNVKFNELLAVDQ